MKRTVASRSVGRGLARVEPTTSDTLIAFAAKAGSTVEDGSGTHSPFTTALLKYIVEPGLDLRIAFGRVRDEVLKITRNRQEPFVYGSLGGNTVALVPAIGDSASHSDNTVSPVAQHAREYDVAAAMGTQEAWDAFLSAHPTGFYADLARAQRAKLLGRQKASLTPPSRPSGSNRLQESKSAPTPEARPSRPTTVQRPPKKQPSAARAAPAYCRALFAPYQRQMQQASAAGNSAAMVSISRTARASVPRECRNTYMSDSKARAWERAQMR
jgi:hypothetical protein